LRLEGLDKLKIHLIGIRSRDLPACSIVPQPTTLPRAPDVYRGVHLFKNGYQLRTNLLKDENYDLLADSHNNLNRWKNTPPSY
jgi:hypothetical protein